MIVVLNYLRGLFGAHHDHWLRPWVPAFADAVVSEIDRLPDGLDRLVRRELIVLYIFIGGVVLRSAVGPQREQRAKWIYMERLKNVWLVADPDADGITEIVPSRMAAYSRLQTPEEAFTLCARYLQYTPADRDRLVGVLHEVLQVLAVRANQLYRRPPY